MQNNKEMLIQLLRRQSNRRKARLQDFLFQDHSVKPLHTTAVLDLLCYIAISIFESVIFLCCPACTLGFAITRLLSPDENSG